MNQQFLVVDASLINLLFEKVEVLGRGKDLIHGISSITYMLKKKKNNQNLDFTDDWGNHALQIYENLNLEVFETKVLQLQKAMTVYLNSYSTRIILIAKEQLNHTQYNLYVVYELKNINMDLKSLREFQTEGLNYDQARKFLIFLCQNYFLGAQYTNEFLDISPQNIFKTEDSYIISNFGITFAGTKFNRIYLPSTDPINKEKNPSKINIQYSYAFKAALLTLCLMTQIDSKDFFFDDGQFKEHVLDNLLYLILDKEDLKKNKDQNKYLNKDTKFILSIPKFFDTLIHTRQLDYNQQKNNNNGNPFTYVKSDRFLKYKYYKEFLVVLKKLLNVTNIQTRSIFVLLISQQDNILSAENPYSETIIHKYNYQNGTFIDKKLNGCGIIMYEEGDQTNRSNKRKIIQKCGKFMDGKEIDAYNIVNIHQTKFECTLYNLQCGLTFRYVNQELLYLTDQIVSPINQIGKSQKESIYYFKGEIKNGQFIKGVSYQLDKTIFEGQFLNNQPFQGKMTYPNQDVFEGIMEGFNKKKGYLITKKIRFEGEFQNDQIFKGLIEYRDGGIFYGQFQNGLKVKAGIYKYPYTQIQYQGLYVDDVRHGQGRFIDKSQENCTQEVIYNYGKCVTKINEYFSKALKEIQEKKKQQKNIKQLTTENDED
ncbi:unnamed protein product [Paramecium primaurelia]|uniref:Uncharacterized protein n=1 Tax=Paramecium primaurelia TaxID=5886 RepID=A0A8S1PV19_PARPR|nr:unnamed protein product [Paramecium primaurelia]